MFRWILTMCFALLLTGSAQAWESIRIPGRDSEGMSFPDLELVVDGRTQRMRDIRGVRFVTFWASYCPPCLRELSEVQNLMSDGRYGDVQFVAINVDASPARMRSRYPAYASFRGVKALLRHPGLVQDIGALPRSFVLDSRGRVLAEAHGYHPDGVTELLDAALRDQRTASR